MDPFGDLFSFINNDDLKEGGVQTGEKKPRKKLVSILCQLCKEGKVHEKCKQKSKSVQKTDVEFACDKCEYTSNIKYHLQFHIEAVHLNIKNFRCSSCLHETYQKVS